jgi:sugar lactone lactonase YvrE
MLLDISGGFYVSDELNNRVLFFPAGSSVATRVYGQSSFAVGSANAGGSNPTAATLNSPHGLAMDASGKLYVADWANNRVVVFP